MKKKIKKKRDLQLEEFEKRDLGDDFKRSGTAVVIHSKVNQTPTSIYLSPDIINKLRVKAQKRGIGYQTMLKIIVHEHVDEY